MIIGVVGFQGAVSEHFDAISLAMKALEIKGEVIEIRSPADVDKVDGIVIPGGESTTISRHLRATGAMGRIAERANKEDLPIMGTCAGCIMLAKGGDRQMDHTAGTLALMDMLVNRNAFGRQRESFEVKLEVEGIAKDFPGVFIRGPSITEVSGNCKAICTLDGIIVAASQGRRLALCFHPELTGDLRIHKHFLKIVQDWKSKK
jgi:5'-phosphate synthase pdxT subunit